MICPHCQAPLSSISIETTDGENQSINECLNCGGHFLSPFLTAFITSETAKNIDSVIPKIKYPPTSDPVCPNCEQRLSAIKDDTVPQTVTVYTCPNNHGDFFPKGQLLNLKKAQEAKIFYHKLWGIPLKSAFALIVPLFILLTAVASLPSLLTSLKNTQENRVKAGEIISTPLITPIANTEVLLSFSTQKPVQTAITFTEGLQTTQTISSSPQTNHLLHLTNLEPGTLYKYHLTLTQNGKKTISEEYTFATP